MAEHNPIYTAAITADTIQYKPLSLFAIAGFSVSILFALLVLAFAVDGLLRGQPFFLPAILILLPIAGVILSGLGLWEVRTSEGTRAGAKLATWGLAISLVIGICYYVYQTVTGLAIIQQANRFLMDKEQDSGFFPRVQGSEIDLRGAFLLTLRPSERQGIDPARIGDMERLDIPSPQAPKGVLSRFLESYLVRVLREGRPNVTIEPGAVRDWSYDSGTYKVNRIYRVITEDGSWDVPLSLVSTEPEAEGDKRRWRVEFMQMGPLQPVSLTDQGRRKQALRRQAYKFLINQDGLFASLVNRKGFDVYLAQQQPQDRNELRQRDKALKARTPLVAVAGPIIPPLELEQEENLLKAFLPQYAPLSKFADSVEMTAIRFVEPKDVDDIRAAAVEALSLSKLPSLGWTATDDELAPLETKAGEVIIKLPIEIAVRIEKKLPGSKDAPIPVPLRVLGNVVVAAPSTLDPNAAGADREWRVVRIELLRAVPVLSKGPTPTMG
jgi:hypothetical protein